MRAVSPIIATVLLIALVVIVAAIINLWISNFTGSTKEMREEADTQLFCSKTEVSFGNMKYCNSHMSGVIHNSGTSDIENLVFFVLYQNGTQQINDLNKTLISGYVEVFNFTANSEYAIVGILTNCTDKDFSLKRNEISAC